MYARAARPFCLKSRVSSTVHIHSKDFPFPINVNTAKRNCMGLLCSGLVLCSHRLLSISFSKTKNMGSFCSFSLQMYLKTELTLNPRLRYTNDAWAPGRLLRFFACGPDGNHKFPTFVALYEYAIRKATLRLTHWFRKTSLKLRLRPSYNYDVNKCGENCICFH